MNNKNNNNYAWVLSAGSSRVTSFTWSERSSWSPSKKELIARYIAESAVMDGQHADPRLLSAYAYAVQLRDLVGALTPLYIQRAATRLKRVDYAFKPSPEPIIASVKRLLDYLNTQ